MQPGMRILEVGCGCGTESLWFAFRGAHVTGIDLASDRLRVARSRKSVAERHFNKKVDAAFEESNIFDLKGQKFDIIFMEQAYHHIEPRASLPEKINSLLAPGGFLVISEANALNLLIQLQLFAKRGFKTVVEYTDEGGIHHVYGNERITTMSSIKKQFAPAGLSYVAHDYFRIMPNIKRADLFLGIEKYIPKSFAPIYTHFNIIMRKK